MSRLSLDSFSSVVLYLGYLFLLVILDFFVTGQLFWLCCSPVPLADHIQPTLSYGVPQVLLGSWLLIGR